ncbi:MAG: hypothetical protein QOE21_435, partial [Microbacteriaceae bacterium]|nr:hypothetical protein [Microbacteriaceae bacterium]
MRCSPDVTAVGNGCDMRCSVTDRELISCFFFRRAGGLRRVIRHHARRMQLRYRYFIDTHLLLRFRRVLAAFARGNVNRSQPVSNGSARERWHTGVDAIRDHWQRRGHRIHGYRSAPRHRESTV